MLWYNDGPVPTTYPSPTGLSVPRCRYSRPSQVTPAHMLQRLPSPPTIAIHQPPLAISTEPSRRQSHAFYQSEPISPECAALHQSLETLFNVSLPHCPPSRATVPMAAISDSQSRREEARHSPLQSSIPSTCSRSPEDERHTKPNREDLKAPASPHHMWHKQQAYKWQLDQWRDDKDKRPSLPQSSAAASPTATDVHSPNLEDIPEDDAPEEERTSPIIADEDPETLNIPRTLQDP